MSKSSSDLVESDKQFKYILDTKNKKNKENKENKE